MHPKSHPEKICSLGRYCYQHLAANGFTKPSSMLRRRSQHFQMLLAWHPPPSRTVGTSAKTLSPRTSLSLGSKHAAAGLPQTSGLRPALQTPMQMLQCQCRGASRTGTATTTVPATSSATLRQAWPTLHLCVAIVIFQYLYFSVFHGKIF